VKQRRAIIVDPEVMGGVPCFRGTRVPFQTLIDYLRAGNSLDEFVRQFPSVERKLAVEALSETGWRQPGALAGRIHIAPGFDDLPADIAEAFEAEQSSRTKPDN
jgi:uncharacterized protein (DUF433 family)